MNEDNLIDQDESYIFNYIYYNQILEKCKLSNYYKQVVHEYIRCKWCREYNTINKDLYVCDNHAKLFGSYEKNTFTIMKNYSYNLLIELNSSWYIELIASIKMNLVKFSYLF